MNRRTLALIVVDKTRDINDWLRGIADVVQSDRLLFSDVESILKTLREIDGKLERITTEVIQNR